MFPDIIGDHAPKIGDGVITFTLILITSHEYQCMLSPNNEKKIYFLTWETFESTLLFHHGSSEAALKVLSLAEFRSLYTFILSLWF